MNFIWKKNHFYFYFVMYDVFKSENLFKCEACGNDDNLSNRKKRRRKKTLLLRG